MTDWPSYKRARDLPGAVFPISEAMILQLARQHGVGRKAGRCIGFEKVRQHGKQRLAVGGVLALARGEIVAGQLGLGVSNPPRGDARWPRDDWPTKSAHCRGLPTGVSLSQTAIARIVRRGELLPVWGLPIAMEEPPCPSPQPCKSTWIRTS